MGAFQGVLVHGKFTECPTCGDGFIPRRRNDRGGSGMQKFCQRSCYHKGTSGKHDRHLVPVTKLCAACNRPYVIGSNRGNKHRARQIRERRFCSLACQRGYRSRFNVFFNPKRKYEGFCGRDGVFVPWHRVMAEKALGRSIKNRNETVHHVDGIKTHNVNTNFVICTPAYHKWLHQRMGFLYQQEHFVGRVG